MNGYFTIRREFMLKALRLPAKVPVGQEGEWEGVVVKAGFRGDHEVVIPRVRLLPSGVANRVRVTCPRCGKWMRFSALQQHVGTKACTEGVDAKPE